MTEDDDNDVVLTAQPIACGFVLLSASAYMHAFILAVCEIIKCISPLCIGWRGCLCAELCVRLCSLDAFGSRYI